MKAFSIAPVALVLASTGVAHMNAQSEAGYQVVEPEGAATPPANPYHHGSGSPSWYYPTQDEIDLIGGESTPPYLRGGGSLSTLGPDVPGLTAPGLWGSEPYEVAPPNFYERNSRFFRPIDKTLGVFVPRELVAFEGDTPSPSETSLFVDPGFPLTRNFDPDRSTFKLGPLYGDILRVGAEAIWSDFNNDDFGDFGDDDGWLSVITLDARALLQLTDNLFLSISGRVYYLPGENEAGFYFGDGGNASYARLQYETALGDWSVLLYDEFRVVHPLSQILDEVEVDEIERAGRYRYGRFDSDRASAIFEDDSIYFVNTLGLEVGRQLNDDWLFKAGYAHYNTWRTFDFDHITEYDRLHASLRYTGDDWNFTPYAYYSLTALDDYQDWRHSALVGVRGRLTSNVRADARIGYYHQDNADKRDRDGLLWQGGILHELGPYTDHSLYAGTTLADAEFGNEFLGSFVRYTIRQELGSRLRVSGFAQWFDVEDLEEGFGERSGWLFGANVGISLTNSTWISLRASYDYWDERGDGGLRADRERWLFRGSLSHQILPHLLGRLDYQYEDFGRDGEGGYTEHLVRIGLFRYF